MKIIINQFPTHIAKTKNKVAPDKYIKINGQSIYNSNLNRFARNIVMSNLHDYLEPAFKPFKGLITEYPIKITINIFTVRNHGAISRRSGTIRWKKPKSDYVPNWDIENLATIWIKAINDTLSKTGVIPDDNIKYLNGVSYNYIEVEDINDRKLEIIIDEEV